MIDKMLTKRIPDWANNFNTISMSRFRISYIFKVLLLILLICVFGRWMMSSKPVSTNYPASFEKNKIESIANAFIKNDASRLINLTNFEYIMNHPCDNSSTPNVFILVMTTPQSWNKRKIIRETWGQAVPKDRLFFLLGAVNDTSLQAELVQENLKFHDIIQGNFDDTSRNRTIKSAMALKWFISCPHLSYLVKVDDNVFLNTPVLFDYLDKKKFDERNLLFCHIENSNERFVQDERETFFKTFDGTFPPHCWGGAVIFSYDVAQKLYSKSQERSSFFWMENVDITGIVRERANINLTKFGENVILGNEVEELIAGEINKKDVYPTFFVAGLKLKENAIRKLWEIFSVQRKMDPDAKKIELARKCFHSTDGWPPANISVLGDILDSKVQPKPRKSIFFLETSCFKDGLINLNTRQACTVESAALWNPNRTIFVLFPSPSGFSNGSVSPIIRALQSYPNIHFRNLDIETFAARAQAKDFIKSGKLFLSKYMNVHLSDFLRIVSLYIYGGIYLDLDSVVLKSFDELPPNFTGHEIDTAIANAVLGFQDNFVSKIMLELMIRGFVSDFRGQEYNYQGPALLTRILRKICETNKVSEMTPEKCAGFKVFPPYAFYEIHWKNWKQFFDAHFTNEVIEKVKNSTVVHMWNSVSFGLKIKKSNPETPYGAIAAKNCPKVFKSSGEYF